MTLSQIVKAIELIAQNQPAINMVVENDIFRLNKCPDARYGVFGWTQGQHTAGSDRSLISYTFTFYYIDRLTEDRKNQIEVQSVGITTLYNIVKELDARGLYNENYSFQTFNQRFIDECAGAMVTVVIDVPVDSLCSEEYENQDMGDFLDTDFNDDFLIF